MYLVHLYLKQYFRYSDTIDLDRLRQLPGLTVEAAYDAMCSAVANDSDIVWDNKDRIRVAADGVENVILEVCSRLIEPIYYVISPEPLKPNDLSKPYEVPNTYYFHTLKWAYNELSQENWNNFCTDIHLILSYAQNRLHLQFIPYIKIPVGLEPYPPTEYYTSEHITIGYQDKDGQKHSAFRMHRKYLIISDFIGFNLNDFNCYSNKLAFDSISQVLLLRFCHFFPDSFITSNARFSDWAQAIEIMHDLFGVDARSEVLSAILDLNPISTDSALFERTIHRNACEALFHRLLTAWPTIPWTQVETQFFETHVTTPALFNWLTLSDLPATLRSYLQKLVPLSAPSTSTGYPLL